MTRFSKEPAVAALAAQFVPIKVDTGGSPEWTRVYRKYKYEGNGIPILMVIRADGKQLYGRSGSPAQLAQFLAGQLKVGGKVLNARQVKELTEAGKQVEELTAAGKVEEAVPLVNKYAGSGSFAESAVAMDAVAAKLLKAAEDELETADKQLRDRKTAIDGALAFAKVERIYRRLPALAMKLNVRQREYRKDAALRDLVEQARLIDRAREFKADEKTEQALAVMQSVVEKYPDSPGAELAKAEIPELTKLAKTTPGGAKKPTATTVDEKRAASQLRFAKALLKRNNGKAKEYLERAIKLAPGTKIAEEAKKLLDSL